MIWPVMPESWWEAKEAQSIPDTKRAKTRVHVDQSSKHASGRTMSLLLFPKLLGDLFKRTDQYDPIATNIEHSQ